MLSIWQREPERIIGLVAALALAAVVMWAPLDNAAKGPLVAALVLLAHEVTRSQVTPLSTLAPPVAAAAKIMGRRRV